MKAVALCLAAVVGIGSAATAVSAAVQNPGLTGTVQTDQWDFSQVTNPTATAPYGGFGSTSAWTQAIDSNVVGMDATFMKTSGYGYVSNGNGVYSGNFQLIANDPGGQFTTAEAHALSGLQTIVFQLDISEALGYDLHDNALPTLSYTTSSGTTSNVAPDAAGFLTRVQIGTFTPPPPNPQDPFPVYRNTRIMQWDLSGVGSPISSFDIHWETVAHSWMYAARLDQSNTYTPVTVPEPATLGLLSLGGLVLLRRRQD